MSSVRGLMALPAVGLAALAASGCAGRQPTFTGRGVVFYCGGAGGGPGITNWGRGVKRGLVDAGYRGTFDEFDWETHLGALVDEEEGLRAKRAQAATLARRITAYEAQFPDSPVDLVGLSAGTAIAVFALEALPAGRQVDTVVLLSSSLASDYDLARALRHVRGDMYVTTSANDGVLKGLAPIFGTADRQYVGQRIAGLQGLDLPRDADRATRRLYAKIVYLAWDPELDRYGDYGGHTDTTRPEFVQHVIAPLLLRVGPRYVRVHPQGSGGLYGRTADPTGPGGRE